MAKCPEYGEPLVKMSKNGGFTVKMKVVRSYTWSAPTTPAISRAIRTSLSKP